MDYVRQGRAGILVDRNLYLAAQILTLDQSARQASARRFEGGIRGCLKQPIQRTGILCVAVRCERIPEAFDLPPKAWVGVFQALPADGYDYGAMLHGANLESIDA
jgi:hypothetical protein